MKTCHRYLSNFKVLFITEKQYLYESFKKSKKNNGIKNSQMVD